MNNINSKISAYEFLQTLLENTDDEGSLKLMIEIYGKDLYGAIDALVMSIQDDQSRIDGIKETINAMQSRKSRFEHAIDQKKAQIIRAMDALGEKAIKRDLFTVSKRSLGLSVVVTDESELPADYLIPQPPKVDKKKLKDDVVNNGLVIKGTSISNGGESITIRIK
jgi:hypothetical protein